MQPAVSIRFDSRVLVEADRSRISHSLENWEETSCRWILLNMDTRHENRGTCTAAKQTNKKKKNHPSMHTNTQTWAWRGWGWDSILSIKELHILVPLVSVWKARLASLSPRFIRHYTHAHSHTISLSQMWPVWRDMISCSNGEGALGTYCTSCSVGLATGSLSTIYSSTTILSVCPVGSSPPPPQKKPTYTHINTVDTCSCLFTGVRVHILRIGFIIASWKKSSSSLCYSSFLSLPLG